MEGEQRGHYTRMLGGALELLAAEELNGLYRVYYDHKLVNPDRIVAQMNLDGQVDNLAYPDIAIVSTRGSNESLLVLAEIEEHKSSPKRLLGDIAAIMMSERVKVGNRCHPMADVVILLGVVTKKRGKTGPKAYRYVSRFEEMVGEGMGGKRGIRCEVICADSGLMMVDAVKKRIKSILQADFCQ